MTGRSSLAHDLGMPLRVLVVDDQPSFRAAMATVIDHADGLELAAQADSGESALALVDAGLRVDIAVIDVHMGGIDGAVTADRLHALDPSLTAVLTSTYHERDLPPSVTASEFTYVPKASLDPEHLRRLWEHDHHEHD